MSLRLCAPPIALIIFLGVSPSLSHAGALVNRLLLDFCQRHDLMYFVKEFCFRNLGAIFLLALVTEVFWFYKRKKPLGKITHLQCLSPLIVIPVIDVLLTIGPCSNFFVVLAYWLPATYLTMEFMRTNATDARRILIIRCIFALCAAIFLAGLLIDEPYVEATVFRT